MAMLIGTFARGKNKFLIRKLPANYRQLQKENMDKTGQMRLFEPGV